MEKQAVEGQRLAVGVDVGKDELVAAVWLAQEQRAEELVRVANTEAGLVELATAVEAQQKAQGTTGVHLTVEPTGKYESRLAYDAYRRGWLVSVVTPNAVRDYAGSLSRRAKTDKQDALILARFTADRQPAGWTPPQETLDDLEMLLSRRRDLTTMLQAERNRQHSFAARVRVTPAVQNSLVESVQQLKNALAEIDKAIKDLLDHNEPFAEQIECLDSIPGIGPKTLPPVLNLCLRWNHLTEGKGNHQGLTAFIGLDPTVYQSGSSVRKRGLISKKGNPLFRAALYQAALGAIRGKNALHAYYDRLVASGKKKKIALVAVAHKILIWAWHIFLTKKPYDASLHAKTT